MPRPRKKDAANAVTPLEGLESLANIVRTRYETAPDCQARREAYDYLSGAWHYYGQLLLIGQMHLAADDGAAGSILTRATQVALLAANLWRTAAELPDPSGAGNLTTNEGFKWATLPRDSAAVPFRFATAAGGSSPARDHPTAAG